MSKERDDLISDLVTEYEDYLENLTFKELCNMAEGGYFTLNEMKK
jgi:hypothetical protein